MGGIKGRKSAARLLARIAGWAHLSGDAGFRKPGSNRR